MFNPDFINVDIDEIVKDIKVKGYFAFEQALTTFYVDELLGEINFDPILVNNNDVGVVRSQQIKYLTHCLASSKKTYEVITAQKIIEVCRNYFTDSYKLTNHRVYETAQSSHMPWHTDNNRQSGKDLCAKHEMPGLLFLFYLSDVERNPFQFIKDSHKWSSKYNKEIYLSDKYVEETYGEDIISFKMKKGTLIISDINGIHRSEPFQDKRYKRTTLLFQVDQTGSDNQGHGEKNLLNSEYLTNLTPEVMDYLGFGFKRDYPAFPNSSAATLTTADILALQKRLLPQIFKAMSRNLLKAIIPESTFINIKRMKWKMKLKNAK